MGEKIPYHDGNDGINLGKLEIKKITLENTKFDLDSMKGIMKTNIKQRLDSDIQELINIFVQNDILKENNGILYINNNNNNNNIFSLEEIILKKNKINDYFDKNMNNNLFGNKEKDIFSDNIKSINDLVKEIESSFKINNKIDLKSENSDTFNEQEKITDEERKEGLIIYKNTILENIERYLIDNNILSEKEGFVYYSAKNIKINDNNDFLNIKSDLKLLITEFKVNKKLFSDGEFKEINTKINFYLNLFENQN